MAMIAQMFRLHNYLVGRTILLYFRLWWGLRGYFEFHRLGPNPIVYPGLCLTQVAVVILRFLPRRENS
jgi:hypothetical protein